MKYTFIGSTGRAQLTVIEPSKDDRPIRYQVRLLPRRASWNTSFASAGDKAYDGSDLEMAVMHIRAWTGIENPEIPARLRERLEPAVQAA